MGINAPPFPSSRFQASQLVYFYIWMAVAVLLGSTFSSLAARRLWEKVNSKRAGPPRTTKQRASVRRVVVGNVAWTATVLVAGVLPVLDMFVGDRHKNVTLCSLANCSAASLGLLFAFDFAVLPALLEAMDKANENMFSDGAVNQACVAASPILTPAEVSSDPKESATMQNGVAGTISAAPSLPNSIVSSRASTEYHSVASKIHSEDYELGVTYDSDEELSGGDGSYSNRAPNKFRQKSRASGGDVHAELSPSHENKLLLGDPLLRGL